MNDLPDIASLLIRHGADVNSAAKDGLTPLHFAAHFGDPEIAGLLLTKGADPNLKGAEEETPLDVAKTRKNQKVADIIADAMDESGGAKREGSAAAD